MILIGYINSQIMPTRTLYILSLGEFSEQLLEPLQVNIPFLYSLKSWENPVFWYFYGVTKDNLKWWNQFLPLFVSYCDFENLYSDYTFLAKLYLKFVSNFVSNWKA